MKTYIAPSCSVFCLDFEAVMITASPGISGDYDPSKPIEAPRMNVGFESSFESLWEDD